MPYEITSHFLPEEEVPKDLTGCKVETPKGWIGTVQGNRGNGQRDVDFGRGDFGVRPEELLRQRVIRIPNNLEN